MIETKQRKSFSAVIVVGSFTGAGEHLGVSQSAVSQQVRALEEELGAPLLVRAGKSFQLTPAGEMVLHCVVTALRALAGPGRPAGDRPPP